MRKNKVFVGLVHYPVYNKHKETMATSITNLDIHDISRCCATYDIESYYVIHPHPSQREVARELLGFWLDGYGAAYNPDRKEALARLVLAESLAWVERDILEKHGGETIRVVTDASMFPESISYAALRPRLFQEEAQNYLLLFGTGYGLGEEVMAGARLMLAPIPGKGAYNHLSVRSAAAIILDRLLGEDWWQDGQ